MASFALILCSVTSPLDFVEPWQEVQWVSRNGLMTDSNVLLSASAIFTSGFFSADCKVEVPVCKKANVAMSDKQATNAISSRLQITLSLLVLR
jgi:hypothetical protein